MNTLLVYITNPSKKIAEHIAGQLLKKKLIACANIFPVHSMYNWKGKMAKGREFVLLAKTFSGKYTQLEKEVSKIHPYEIPCIINIPAEANKKFSAWMQKELA